MSAYVSWIVCRDNFADEIVSRNQLKFLITSAGEGGEDSCDGASVEISNLVE